MASENEKITFKEEAFRPTTDFWMQQWKLKDNWMSFQILEGKKPCNLEFPIQQKYLLKEKIKYISENTEKFYQQ